MPTTYAGRAVSIFVRLTGIVTIALLAAIIVQKLDFSRPEKYVHIFVLNTELAKQETVNQVCPTAKIRIIPIKSDWRWIENGYRMVTSLYLFCFILNIAAVGSIKYFNTHRKLIKSIDAIRRLRDEQRKLIDSTTTIAELFQVQKTTSKRTDNVRQQIAHLESKMEHMEQQLTTLNTNVQLICSKLNNETAKE
ncbi:unnamed protein product [Didymodactylos carnosus]|uniref:Uncharacterized protein n=1 Tax=Didymodactylos carnosus TaxID=1234261 RepID=A0A815Y3J8_9BILA|nr:unnamed protein product [Didymodactylos carnosus]CAF4428179.1 unnamed protein product [Didymodactylos carnosus]